MGTAHYVAGGLGAGADWKSLLIALTQHREQHPDAMYAWQASQRSGGHREKGDALDKGGVRRVTTANVTDL